MTPTTTIKVTPTTLANSTKSLSLVTVAKHAMKSGRIHGWGVGVERGGSGGAGGIDHQTAGQRVIERFAMDVRYLR